MQPVMAGHGDRAMPDICLFAAKNIPAFTELTYDYGQQYVDEKLEGNCYCGATACRGNLGTAARQQPQDDDSSVSADGMQHQ